MNCHPLNLGGMGLQGCSEDSKNPSIFANFFLSVLDRTTTPRNCRHMSKRLYSRLLRKERGKVILGNGANTVSESTVSNTELSEFFGAH